MAKKQNKSTKHILSIIIAIYSIIILGFITTNIFRNKYGIVELNNNMFINITKNDQNNNHKKGDLLIIKKMPFSELIEGSKVVIIKQERYSKKKNIVIGEIERINKKDEYLTIKNDYTHWSKNEIIGVSSTIIPYLGFIFKTISSGNLFFIILLVPIVAFSIQEALIWHKNSHFKKKKVKEIEKEEKEEENDKQEEQNIEPQLIESTDFELIPTIEVNNAENIDANVTDEEAELGTIKIKTSVKKKEEKKEQEEEKQEEQEEEKGPEESDGIVVNENDQSIEIGKGINNFVMKILELKKYEIYTVLSIIYKTKNIDIPVTTIKKIITSYVMDKYIQPIDYSEKDFENRDEILEQKINGYPARRKNLDEKQKAEIVNSLCFYSKLKEDYSNTEKEIDNYYQFDLPTDRNIVIDYIKEKGTSYGKLRKMFGTKVSATKMFKLVLTETVLPNIFNTQVQSNIKFSKIFSEYVIDRSYKESVVMENIEEVLLKLVGSILVNELFTFDYTKRYIISFNSSLYSKQRKVKSFTDNFSDPFSQKKILILINEEVLKKNMRTITELKNKGFNFIIQMKKKELLDAKFDPNVLNIAEYIFIIGKLSANEKNMFIPNSMTNRVYYLEEALNGEVIIK